jgi:hypothetical protein
MISTSSKRTDDKDKNAFVLLFDAARAGDHRLRAMELNKDILPLYEGDLQRDLETVAPYLFNWRDNEVFREWFLDSGWGRSWGVLAQMNLTKEASLKHFRRFLFTRNADGSENFFRFYDPRVVRRFFPVWDVARLNEFFGPVSYLIIEGEGPQEAIKVWWQDFRLHQEKLPVQPLRAPG